MPADASVVFSCLHRVNNFGPAWHDSMFTVMLCVCDALYVVFC